MEMKKTAILAMAAALAASAWAVQGTVKSETDSKTGDIKWQPRSKSYLVSFKKGATAVSSEFPLDSVVKIDVEKPANFDKLVDLVSKGQGQSAVEGLKAIVATYKMIVWDKPAARWLVQAYLDAGKAQQAYDTAQDLIKDDKRRPTRASSRRRTGRRSSSSARSSRWRTASGSRRRPTTAPPARRRSPCAAT